MAAQLQMKTPDEREEKSWKHTHTCTGSFNSNSTTVLQSSEKFRLTLSHNTQKITK